MKTFIFWVVIALSTLFLIKGEIGFRSLDTEICIKHPEISADRKSVV